MSADAARVLDAFGTLLDCAPTERSGMIERLAAGDAEMAAELRELLAADQAAQGFLEDSGEPQPGTRIGPWQLQQVLGAGGMGQVWLAQRADGQFEGRAAIKFMHLQLPEFTRRFALERQALARLEHPCIARMLDAGVDHGRPWIAMEHVDGEGLRQWAATRDLRARMQLLATVAETVHAAHTRLVVHRDLKPANILVTTDDCPKLLDFGIAKLLDRTGDGLTRDGAQPFTPDYASPEQRRGEAIGTASDVYALGVIGYELATGQLPAQGDPALPSALAPADRRQALRGDLDQVLLHALAELPTARHPGAAALAADLRHWLAGESVSVRAPAWRERVLRWMRRHTALAIATLTAVAALLVGGGVAVWQAHEAGQAAERALAERDKAEAVRGFLERILASANPRVGSREMTVVEVLGRADALIDQSYARQPAIAAEVLRTLSSSWRGLGDLERARALAERAVTRVQASDAAPAERARVLLELAQVNAERGDAAALAQFDQAIAVLAATDGSAFAHADALNNRGVLRRQLGDLDGAEQDYQTALSLHRANGGSGQWIGGLLNNRAVLANSRGDAAAAVQLHQEAVAALRSELADDHPDVAEARAALASALEIVGDLAAADAMYALALPALEHSLGADHPKVIQTLASWAWLLLRLDRPEPALALAERAVAGAGHSLEATHALHAYARVMRGSAHAHLQQWPQAVVDLSAALEARRATLPSGHWLIANNENALAHARLFDGDSSARADFDRSLASLREQLGDAHEVTGRALVRSEQLRAAGLLR